MSTAIPKESLVLVTGANGFIASHVVDQLLQGGYKVRGTVRTESKGAWVQKHFDAQYGTGKLEIVVVADMAAKGAFDEAVKGTSGVIHVASNLGFLPDPNEIIPSCISGIDNTLAAAETEPMVKRFVYTSSSMAAAMPSPDVKFDIDENTWNSGSIERAWAPPPYEDPRKWDVYGASKAQTEQALWKFAKEKKPHFEVNAVLPNANFGPILSPENQDASTGAWVPGIYTKGMADVQDLPPQWFVDVRDTARLHVAALLDPTIKNERIFAFAEPYTWNRILGVLRKVRPDHKFPDDIADNSEDLSRIVRQERAEEILQKNFGQSHFVGLEESIKANLAHLK